MLANEIYPFATQDGKAIPLDILLPAGFMFCDVDLTSAEFALPVAHSVATFNANENCLVRFGAAVPALASGTEITDCLYVPRGVIVISSLPAATIHVRTMTAAAAVLNIQFIQKWAGLALDRQFQRK